MFIGLLLLFFSFKKCLGTKGLKLTPDLCIYQLEVQVTTKDTRAIMRPMYGKNIVEKWRRKVSILLYKPTSQSGISPWLYMRDLYRSESLSYKNLIYEYHYEIERGSISPAELRKMADQDDPNRLSVECVGGQIEGEDFSRLSLHSQHNQIRLSSLRKCVI